MERLLADQPPRYVRWSRAPFLTTASERRDAVVEICRRVDALAPAIVDAGAAVPEARWEAIEPWIDALSTLSSS